jgi:hypothetical protein
MIVDVLSIFGRFIVTFGPSASVAYRAAQCKETRDPTIAPELGNEATIISAL